MDSFIDTDVFIFSLIIAISATSVLVRTSRIKHIKEPSNKDITNISLQIGTSGSISAIFWGISLVMLGAIVNPSAPENWLVATGSVLGLFGGVLPVVGIILFNRTVGKIIKEQTLLESAKKNNNNIASTDAKKKRNNNKLNNKSVTAFIVGWIFAGVLTLMLGYISGIIEDYNRFVSGQSTSLTSSQITGQNQARLYPIHQDPELLGILETVRTDKDESLDDLKIVWEKPDTEWAVGDQRDEWDYNPSRIRISPDVDRNYLWEVLAHEYVHYRYKQGENEQTDSDLMNRVWADGYFIERSQKYDFNNEESGEYSHYEEAMAFGCTALADWRLTPHLISECNKIVDRNKLAQFLR